jgi:Tol biopolymer transport system component
MAPVDGGLPERLVPTDSTVYSAGSWSPDGRHLTLVHVSRTSASNIVALTMDRSSALTPLLTTEFNETAPAFSPAGGWLAYVSDRTGRNEVYLAEYPVKDRAVQVSTGGGREPVWSPDGRELFYRDGDSLMAVSIGRHGGVRVSTPRKLFTGRYDERPSWRPNYAVARDGRFLMVRSAVDPRAGSTIAVLLNWDRSTR